MFQERRSPRFVRNRRTWCRTPALPALLAALLVPAVLAAPATAQPHPQARQGWLVGFSVGGGSAAITANGQTSDREGGGAGSFRAGYAFTPELALELNSNLWTKEESGVTLTFSSHTAALNYFPGASGIVLRAGVGIGSGEAEVKVGNVTVTGEETGFAINGGVAYEFRVGRMFALGPQIDFGWTALDSFDANWINFGLGFNWYFIPR